MICDWPLNKPLLSVCNLLPLRSLGVERVENKENKVRKKRWGGDGFDDPMSKHKHKTDRVVMDDEPVRKDAEMLARRQSAKDLTVIGGDGEKGRGKGEGGRGGGKRMGRGGKVP